MNSARLVLYFLLLQLLRRTLDPACRHKRGKLSSSRKNPMKLNWMRTALLGGTIALAPALAQAPSESFPPAATVKQLMLDLIHPSSNYILLAFTPGPKTQRERPP